MNGNPWRADPGGLGQPLPHASPVLARGVYAPRSHNHSTGCACHRRPAESPALKALGNELKSILTTTEHSVHLAHAVPGTVSHTSHILIHLILTASL